MTALLRLALLLLALATLAGCSLAGDDGGPAGGGDAAAEGEAGALEASGVRDASGAPEGGEADGGSADASAVSLPAVGPRVVRTASLRMTVARGRLGDAVTEARGVAARHGGFVVTSTTSREAGARPVRGTVVVRVPERAYAEAMGALLRIGRVVEQEESSEDVSAEFVDLEARARHLEAVERQLLELLDRAGTVPAALAVQSQLNETQLALERVRGRLRFLEDQTAYATISLALRERAPEAREAGGWGVVDAWRDGARAFVHVAGRTFVVLATAAPLLVLLAALGAAFLLVRRHVRARWRATTP